MNRAVNTLAELLGLTAEIQDHRSFLTKHGWRQGPSDAIGESWLTPWIQKGATERINWLPASAIERHLEVLAADVLKAAGWTIYGQEGVLDDGREIMFFASEVRDFSRKGTRYQKLTAGLRSHFEARANPGSALSNGTRQVARFARGTT